MTSKDLDLTGVGKVPEEKGKAQKKKVTTVRFEEGVAEHLSAKERGDRSRYYFKDGKPYVHAPSKLIDGTVVYRCKVVGSMIVAQTQGTQLIREVVDRLSLVSEVRKGGIKDKIIDLAINIRSMIVTDVERKVILLQHPLHQISYSAEDRRFDNIFAYIVRGKKKDQPNICYVLESLDSEASEIAATVGQAFQLAYERFQETKAAQAGFKDLKEKLIADLDKVDFAKQVVELQEKVKEMEEESDAQKMPKKDETTDKFPEVVTQWESITTALKPFSTDPSLDPETQYLVPRPETQELDNVIGRIEDQLEELQDAFSDQWFLLERLTAREKEKALAKEVMKDIDQQVKEMMVDAHGQEPTVPQHYQSREFQRAKEKASLPEIGMVKGKRSQWEQRAKK